MSYFPVKAVSVFLWGRRVGVIAGMQDGKCAFEYDPAFRRSGLEISPIAMPLSKALYSSDEFEVPRRSLHGLPGVFADSLPDSFGNRLVRKWMESRGIEAGAITPLDRLSYVGTRGMGALTYEPQIRPDTAEPTVLDMRRLVDESHLALNARLDGLSADESLREIIRVGTSAGGAQAKAVVGWSRETDSFLAGDTDLPDGFEHWILKFSPRMDPDAGEREFSVYTAAKAAGMSMSPFRHRRGAWAGLRGTRGAVPPDGFQRVQPRDGRPYEELLLPDDGGRQVAPCACVRSYGMPFLRRRSGAG